VVAAAVGDVTVVDAAVIGATLAVGASLSIALFKPSDIILGFPLMRE
jgi:hypothetical protein